MNIKRLTKKDIDSIIGDEPTFANSLKAERESLGMSRKDFCKMLDITVQSLYDLEHGRRIPSPERAARVARQIGEPEAYWIQLALNDELKSKSLNFDVKVS